jgi:hypothetical protein
MAFDEDGARMRTCALKGRTAIDPNAPARPKRRMRASDSSVSQQANARLDATPSVGTQSATTRSRRSPRLEWDEAFSP